MAKKSRKKPPRKRDDKMVIKNGDNMPIKMETKYEKMAINWRKNCYKMETKWR